MRVQVRQTAAKFISAVIMVMLFTVLAGCRQNNSATAANLNIDLNASQVFKVGVSTLIVKVSDANGAAVNDATIEIRGDMNHAGMTPEFGNTRSGTAGEYTVPFNWTMAGEWILTVKARLPDGSESEKKFTVQVEEQP